MNARRFRLALVGVLALAACLAVGLATGSAVAKKKKKGSNSITVSKTTPTPMPAGDGVNEIAGDATASLTVGKKGKGKLVSSLTATYLLTDPGGNLDDVDIKVIAPNGRTVFLDNPAIFFAGGDALTTVGPLTESPDSSTGYCFPDPSPPPSGCPNGSPDNNLAPPWAGTARLLALADFAGVGAKGTWRFVAENFSTRSTHVLSMASLHLNLANKPK